MSENQSFYTDIKYQKHQSFWASKLAITPDITAFIGSVNGRAAGVKEWQKYDYSFDSTSAECLQKYTSGKSLETFVLLFSAFSILMSRYNQAGKFIVNTPVLLSGGKPTESKTLLPHVVEIEENQSLKQFIGKFNQSVLSGYQFQDFPLKLIEGFDEESVKALSNVIISFEGLHEVIDYTVKDSDILISFSLQNGLSCSINYDSLKYHSWYVENLAKNLDYLISQYSNLDALLFDLEIVAPAEKTHLLDTLNRNSKSFPLDKTSVEVFLDIVEQFPNNKALQYYERHLTYKQLDNKSNDLAEYLRTANQIGKGDKVAVMIGKSDYSIISFLAILKLGAVYVPIDPEIPQDRKNYILRDAEVACLLTNSELMFEHQDFGGKVFACDIQIDLLPETGVDFQSADLPAPKDIAYIIYTSGSTGEPKGVEIKHSGILNSVCNQIDLTKMTDQDKFLLFFSMASDGSIQEILTTLLSGAELILFDKKDLLDIEFFKRKVSEIGVTVFSITPSFLNILDQHPLETVRIIVSCAEAVKKQDALFYSKTKDFYNGYGPTETSVSAAIYKVDPDKTYDVIPIGTPCANKQIYILDDQKRLLPAGTIGQIVIGGVGLAKGYLKDSALTERKFVKHPFKKDELVYLSGDKGKIHSDGLIYFYGRMDTQVKLNGLRVDLGEIENSLMDHEQIADCHVKIIGGEVENRDQLVAFVIERDQVPSTVDYRIFLVNKIPEYMIPNQFVSVSAFKLTTSGKLDEKALIKQFQEHQKITVASSRRPATQVEADLLEIWKEVLEKDLGVNDNFFENGGHSLKAAKVIAKIHNQMRKKVQVSELFLHPSVQQLAKFIEGKEESVEDNIFPVGPVSEFPASFQQLRFWTLSKFGKQEQAFNMPGVFDISGDLNQKAFESAVKSLIVRHESLRTIFKESDGKLMQQFLNYEDLGFEIQFRDFTQETEKEQLCNQLIDEVLLQSFDLSKGPLIACYVIQKSENDYTLVINLHHIIADGWSMGIIASEIFKTYESKINNVYTDLEKLTIQYKDYTNWCNNLLTGERGSKMKSYWQEVYAKSLSALNLPVDHDRPARRVFSGSSISHTFSIEYEELQQTARAYNASLFMILYAGLQSLLYKYTGQKDMVIGTDSAGRNHQALENQVGNFLNTLPLRLEFDDCYTFKTLFGKARNMILGAFENQQYPFERILEIADFERNPARTPLFDVYFIIQNYEEEAKSPGNLKITRRGSDTQITKFDLSFYFFENKNSMDMTIEYNNSIFDQSTIENIKNTFCQIIDLLVQKGDYELDQITIQSTNDEEEADFLSRMAQF